MLSIVERWFESSLGRVGILLFAVNWFLLLTIDVLVCQYVDVVYGLAPLLLTYWFVVEHLRRYHQRCRTRLFFMDRGKEPNADFSSTIRMVREEPDLGLVAALSLVLVFVGVWLLCLFFECRPVNWVFVDVVVFASIVICVVILIARMIRDWDKRYDFDLGEEAADEASGN